MVGILATLAPAGDLKSTWDSERPDEVSAARKQFDDLTKKGYLAFKVKKDGDKGELIREFDPEAEKIILSPPVRGG
jgi:hypothetical protein